MKKFSTWALAVFASTLILAACGGSGSSGSAGAAVGGTSLSGTAGTGSPIANAVVTATGANNQVATATTAADGTYTITNLDALTFPVRLSVSFPEGGAVRSLGSVVAALGDGGTAKANINPITDVIAANTAGETDPVALAAAIKRLNGVLAAVLANFNVAAGTDFISGQYTANPSDPVDNALDLLTISFSGGNLVVQSNADPSIVTTIPVTASTTAADVATPPSLPAANTYASPADIKALVDAFGVALARGTNLTAADLDALVHADFRDTDGLDKADFAAGIAEEGAAGLKITVTGYKILRCFADAGNVTDKCYVRVNYTSPTMDGEDYGAAAGGATAADFMDLVAERRDGVSGLRFAGSYFRPFAVEMKLFNQNSIVVNTDGSVTPSTDVTTGLSISASVVPPAATPTEPEQIANHALNAITLFKNFGQGNQQEIFEVLRPSNVQCVGSNNRLVTNPAGGGCGNQLPLAPSNTLAADSAAGLLTAQFVAGTTTEVHRVRLANPTSSALSMFGTLDQTSLKNLVDYYAVGGGTVTVTLTVPAGASFVCLSDGGNNDDICVYGTRQVTIPSDQLARTPGYFVLTRDAENNVFQRHYMFTPLN